MRIFTFLAALFLNGCIAGKAGYYLVEAEKAYGAAEASDAESLAVYEYTMATAYRAKAWEEAGYSDYGPAEAYALKATDFAQSAQQIAETGEPARKLVEELKADEAFVPDWVEQPVEEDLGAPVWEPPPEAPEEESLDWLLDELEVEKE
jgi:hypothetical protein